MHRTDATRLTRQLPQTAKSHHCKVNRDFLQEIRSNGLNSHANFKMLNFKLFNSECQHSRFVTKEKKSLFSCEYKRKNRR